MPCSAVVGSNVSEDFALKTEAARTSETLVFYHNTTPQSKPQNSFI